MNHLHTIGQVAAQLGVSDQTLRNWERQGLIPKVERRLLDSRRVYTDRDIKTIGEFIKRAK